MPKFPIPTEGTAWASGGISGKVKMYSRRRKGGLRQKPWNKPTRMEKWWATPGPNLANAQAEIQAAGVNNALLCCKLDGALLRGEETVAAAPMSMQNVKLHRFQGAIWAWLSPLDALRKYAARDSGTGPVAGQSGIQANTELPPSNVAMCNYVWLKVKELGIDPGEGQLPMGTSGVVFERQYAVSPTRINTMLLRDDIMAWGSVPVFGIVPRMYTNQDATNFGGAIVGNAGMYLQSHVARIPFPRLPKAGLNLGHGEALTLVVNQYNGPGDTATEQLDDSTPDRSLVVWNQFRCLCSA